MHSKHVDTQSSSPCILRQALVWSLAGWWPPPPSACTALSPADSCPALWTESGGRPSCSPAYACISRTTETIDK